MSSYLITGGAGFIGSHLSNYLIKLGHKVTILDNLSSGKKSNINKFAHFIHGSITDYHVLEMAFEKIDFCYHLAAIASVSDSIKRWSECNRINLGGTINVFEIAAKNNIPVIYASSAAVYGAHANIIVTEDEMLKPLSPYGLDKYSVEMHARLFANLKNLKNVGLRFFNVYGPGQDPASAYAGVISIFAGQIVNNKRLQIFGDGTQERDFIYIDDVVQSLIKANNLFALDNSQVLNVCTGIGISLNQLIIILTDILKKEVEIDYLPVRNSDIHKSIGSTQKLLQILGFKTTTTIVEGLKYLCTHYGL